MKSSGIATSNQIGGLEIDTDKMIKVRRPGETGNDGLSV
jgi:hypothetical protein